MAGLTASGGLTVASVWQQCRSVLNALGFAWRQKGSPLVAMAERRVYDEPAEVAELLVGSLWQDRGEPLVTQLTELEAQLLVSPVLAATKQKATRNRYAETLAIAHQLDVMLAEATMANDMESLQWLDVGAKNWAYVAALAHHAGRFANNYRLTGIELDARRLYANGHTRGSTAKTHAAGLPATYKAGDVRDLRGQYDVISWLLPFVVAEPCLLWGLPLSVFQPVALWQHVARLLKPEGLLLVINQGNEEADAQRALIQQTAELKIMWEGWLPETFLPYEAPRYGWCLQKEAEIFS